MARIQGNRICWVFNKVQVCFPVASSSGYFTYCLWALLWWGEWVVIFEQQVIV
jgi:hypothetical protein